MDQAPHFTETLLVTSREISAEYPPLKTWENFDETSGNSALCPRRACNACSSSNCEAGRIQRHGVRITSGNNQRGPHNHDQAEGCSSREKAPHRSFVLVSGLLRPARNRRCRSLDRQRRNLEPSPISGVASHARVPGSDVRITFPLALLTDVEPKGHWQHYDSRAALDLTLLRKDSEQPCRTVKSATRA